MKTTIYISVLLATFISCSTYSSKGKNTNRDNTVVSDTLRIANDSLEYELIVIEPGFNSWLLTQPPRGYYSQSTLELRNNFYVIEYNTRVNSPSVYDPNLYPLRIEYDRAIDYGYEVNYLLFNYFQFFQQRYNQRLR